MPKALRGRWTAQTPAQLLDRGVELGKRPKRLLALICGGTRTDRHSSRARRDPVCLPIGGRRACLRRTDLGLISRGGCQEEIREVPRKHTEQPHARCEDEEC